MLASSFMFEMVKASDCSNGIHGFPPLCGRSSFGLSFIPFFKVSFLENELLEPQIVVGTVGKGRGSTAMGRVGCVLNYKRCCNVQCYEKLTKVSNCNLN